MSFVCMKLCVLAFVATVVFCTCPNGWNHYEDKCFFLSRDNETFGNSLMLCEVIGRQYGRSASLATVHDAKTQQFLTDLMIKINSIGMYIGLNDLVTEGTFHWIANGKQATYFNWGPTQPNNRGGNENCVAMRVDPVIGFNYSWTDGPCTVPTTYICEMVAERKYYYRKRDLAKAHPTRYLSLIIDGMDQSKTNLPHFVGRTAKGGTWPPVLYIQADNCWRENKNKYVLSFCELLVHICMKVFQEVHLSFLYVGHTHEDIDAGFSKIADSLRRNDAETIPELLDLLPNPSNLIWQYDIRSWLEPFIADVRKHTKPLHYKFTMDEVSNKIKLCYKSIHAGPWKISTSGMFMFSDKGEVELPKGVPKVATPVFDKISIEKIESGINDWKCLFTDQIEHHQFNWWKSRVNYMKKLRDDNQFMKSEIIQKAVWYLDKLPKIRVTPDCLEDNNSPKEIEDMINQVLIEHEIKKMAREACNGQFKKLAKVYEQDVTESIKKYQVLKDLDLFVLDNSIRESTVGQLRGHTIENKWKVYDEVKKCGFKHTIVASFNHSTQVDDVFIKQLIDKGEDRAGLWAFSEITEAIKKKVPDTESIPVGLRKMKEAGLYNVIFEIDLGDSTYDFDRFTTKEMCALLKKWIDWVFKNLSTEAKVFVNFRDLPDAMPTDSERVFEVTDFLCKLPLFGLMFEEPRGQSLPEECGTWAKHIRKVMDANNFKSHLLVHVHEKFGYCDAVALQVLMDGANGIWASVIKEGAAMGNAPSIVTILNLIRMGNKKVLKKFNCTYLRKAAINMTRITTGVDPHIKQPVYGARALDFVLDLNAEEFDFAEFFEEKAPIRITTISSAKMVQTKLVNYFGENKDFTIERANLMKEVMLEDLRANRKEEYMSKCGLAVLFDRAGGKLTDEIRDEIANDPIKTPHGQNLLKEIRERWDEWDLKDKVQGDNLLDFDSFYNGFMAPYFACYRCNDTKKALQALDMDSDNSVDWSEFCVFLKWALKQYPKTILTADDLLEVAFRKGLIPCMRDEMVGKK